MRQARPQRTFDPMSLQVEPAALADKTIIRRLLELYFYDATEFTGGDLNPHGEFGYRYLDHYWSNDVPPARFPFLFRVDGQIAGFAFVRISENIYSMAEFFILRKYRRSGLGTAAALDLFARFPGSWGSPSSALTFPPKPSGLASSATSRTATTPPSKSRSTSGGGSRYPPPNPHAARARSSAQTPGSKAPPAASPG